MDVPRHWWENALERGIIDNSHAQIIHDYLKELQKLPDLTGRIDPTLLVAISFIDDPHDKTAAKYGEYPSSYSLNDYLEKGRKAIEDHPELYKLGEMIMKSLDEYLEEKEQELMKILLDWEMCWNHVSEDDLKAKHYSLIDQDIPNGYGVSTEWSLTRKRGKGTPSFDLVVIEKWLREKSKEWGIIKECYKYIKPYYAVEYKADDTLNKVSNKQVKSFREQIIRLDKQCKEYLKRGFALYYYRGNSPWEKNPFNESAENYIFNGVKIENPEKLKVYYVGKRVGNRQKIKLPFKL